ncbi:hypothetical protein ACJJTC_009104 [Scirpophaga incertulas]
MSSEVTSGCTVQRASLLSIAVSPDVSSEGVPTGKTPTNVPKPTTPPIGTKADLQGNVEKITKPRVPPQKVDDQTTPRLPTTYADKIKRITNWQLAAKLIPKEPRLTKQKSLDSIQLSQPKPSTSRSQDTLQLISFDRSARTVSPSNLKPTAPTPFPSIHRQEEQDEAAKTRESRKRQLEADETTATQPARPKMQPPAIPTIVTTPPDTLQQQDRQPRVPPGGNAEEAKEKGRPRPLPSPRPTLMVQQHPRQPPPDRPCCRKARNHASQKHRVRQAQTRAI